MKKNIIIIILTVVALIELTLLHRKSASADYWLQRTVAAEDIIYCVYEHDNIYVLDTLSKSNEWDTWVSIASKQEELG